MDTEWAYEGGKLCLLQARPITTHVPLYEEMVTRPGEQKKLYLDVMPLTQGFDESLSVLGGDIWKKVMDSAKRGGMPAGEGGYILNVHGRQYMQLHNMFRGVGKKALAGVLTYDNALEGREEEIFAEYVGTETTPLMKQARSAQLKMGLGLLPVLLRLFWNVPPGCSAHGRRRRRAHGVLPWPEERPPLRRGRGVGVRGPRRALLRARTLLRGDARRAQDQEDDEGHGRRGADRIRADGYLEQPDQRHGATPCSSWLERPNSGRRRRVRSSSAGFSRANTPTSSWRRSTTTWLASASAASRRSTRRRHV